MSHNLRPVQEEDRELLFKWVNDEQVRANSLSSKKIEWEQHVIWFESRIKSSSTKIFILENNGHPVGQIRYDKKENKLWEIDYSIATEYRGMGFGKKIVKLSLKKISGIILAKVKQENTASCKIFEQIGFKVDKRENNIIDYIYK